MKIEIQTKEQVEDRLRVTIAVKDGEVERFGRTLNGRTWTDIQNQIEQLEKNLADVAVEVEKIPLGEFVKPAETVVEAVAPTPAELKQNAINAKSYELQVEVDRIKREKEMAELAQTNPDLATKIAEYEALKLSK